MSRTKYAKQLSLLSGRLFGELSPESHLNHQRNQRVIRILSEKPHHKRPEIVNYYVRLQEIEHIFSKMRYHGVYKDEAKDMKAMLRDAKKDRGKIPNRKGEGKRKTLGKS